MTASDANLVGMYDQGLGVQPDVVEGHMWLTAVFCHRAGVGIRVRYRQPDGSPHHVFARRSRAGDRVTSPVPVPTLQDHAGPLLATRNLRLGPRPYVLNDRLRYMRIVQHGCACYDWSAILSPCSWAFHWALTQTRSRPSSLPPESSTSSVTSAPGDICCAWMATAAYESPSHGADRAEKPRRSGSGI